MLPEPLPSPHHPRTKATTTSSNEQPRSCDTEVELVRMEVMDMTSYCVGVLRYREAWFRTWRNMCRSDARLERGRQNRAWTRLSNPTCPFWGNVPTITSRPARPMHPPTRRGSHGIRSRRPWSVRWLSRWWEASHTHAVDDRVCVPNLDAPQYAMELGVVTGTGIRHVGSPDARMGLLNWK